VRPVALRECMTPQAMRSRGRSAPPPQATLHKLDATSSRPRHENILAVGSPKFVWLPNRHIYPVLEHATRNGDILGARSRALTPLCLIALHVPIAPSKSPVFVTFWF
jgi:hypothetical protein